MLIQQVVSAFRAPFVDNAFVLGSAKPRPVGFGLFRRLFSLSALLKSLQVDQFPHARPRHPTIGARAGILVGRNWSRLAGSMVIGNPRYRYLIASKNMFRSAKTKHFVLYHAAAQRR
jgi:hypothetical protein